MNASRAHILLLLHRWLLELNSSIARRGIGKWHLDKVVLTSKGQHH